MAIILIMTITAVVRPRVLIIAINSSINIYFDGNCNWYSCNMLPVETVPSCECTSGIFGYFNGATTALVKWNVVVCLRTLRYLFAGLTAEPFIWLSLRHSTYEVSNVLIFISLAF